VAYYTSESERVAVLHTRASRVTHPAYHLARVCISSRSCLHIISLVFAYHLARVSHPIFLGHFAVEQIPMQLRNWNRFWRFCLGVFVWGAGAGAMGPFKEGAPAGALRSTPPPRWLDGPITSFSAAGAKAGCRCF
jgi:hypothetical protein